MRTSDFSCNEPAPIYIQVNILQLNFPSTLKVVYSPEFLAWGWTGDTGSEAFYLVCDHSAFIVVRGVTEGPFGNERRLFAGFKKEKQDLVF